jgi:hypothetical protein
MTSSCLLFRAKNSSRWTVIFGVWRYPATEARHDNLYRVSQQVQLSTDPANDVINGYDLRKNGPGCPLLLSFYCMFVYEGEMSS